MISLDDAFRALPLIAILRGLKPDQAIETAGVLVEAGFQIIEVPLNSPEPLISIREISNHFGEKILVGAGTVLSGDNAERVVRSGGQIIVAPNMSPDVAHACAQLNVAWCPGIMTPSEAFAAIELGASILKLFPAEAITPQMVGAMRAVLPSDIRLAAVGGITPQIMPNYRNVGVQGFGLGSALFKPDGKLSDLKARATEFVEAAMKLNAD